MFANRLFFPQIRAIGAPRRAAAVWRFSTSRAENKANDYQRRWAREDAAASEGNQAEGGLPRDVNGPWLDLAGGVGSAFRSAANAAAGSAPNPAKQAAEQIRHAAKQQAAQARKQVERPAAEFAEQARSGVAEAADRARGVAAGVAGRANDAAAGAAKFARGAAAGVVGGARGVTNEIAKKASEYANSAGTLLNESLDAEEDKFASTFSPLNDPHPRRHPTPPVRPEDVRAAQVQQEANMNDLVDELEDKVRNLDHVKQAIAKPLAGRSTLQQGQQQQQASWKR